MPVESRASGMPERRIPKAGETRGNLAAGAKGYDVMVPTSNYILGMAKMGKGVKLLLDIALGRKA